MKQLLFSLSLALLVGITISAADDNSSTPAPTIPPLSDGSTKWVEWNNPMVGAGISFYANAGTFAVDKHGDGMFGHGLGEVTFTSNNANPVDTHQFGSAIWGAGSPTSLFDPTMLSGKAGLEMLVWVDPSATSDKIQLGFLTTNKDEYYSAVETVHRGTVELIKFPYSDFKSNKGGDKKFTDVFTILSGTLQISDTWAGGAQQGWKVKFSNIYTY